MERSPLRVFLERVGADTRARYVAVECADGYYESIDMATRASADADGFQAFGCDTTSQVRLPF